MSYDCWCDYDPPEFCHTEMRRARKPHRCYECGGPIHSGETYEHVRGKWVGDVRTFTTCPLCLDLRDWAKISVPCFCWAFGTLHDDVREMVGEVRHDVPGFVFEWGRRMITIKRRRGGDQRSNAARRNEHIALLRAARDGYA